MEKPAQFRVETNNWGHFENDVLKPAMEDMFGAEDGSSEQKVRRFVGNYELRRAATRGRPVEAVVFLVGKARKHLGEEQKPKIVSLDRERLRKIFETAGMDHSAIPSESLLAQAAGKMDVGIVHIAERWSATISLAKEDPDILVGSLGILTGRQIIGLIAEQGVGDAFTKWLIDWKEPKAVSYRAGHVPSTKPVTARPEPELITVTTIPDAGIDFHDASIIRIEFDDEIRTQRWAQQIIADLEVAHLLSVGQPKMLRLEWNGNGFLDRKDVDVSLLEQTLGLIVGKHREIIDTVEYLA